MQILRPRRSIRRAPARFPNIETGDFIGSTIVILPGSEKLGLTGVPPYLEDELVTGVKAEV